MFPRRPSLIRRQLILQHQELLPGLPKLLVQLGPGLGHGGVDVAAGDDPGGGGSQVRVSIDHAGDEVVEVLGVPVKILQLAAFDVLIVGIIKTVARQSEETGGLVDGEAKGEDVRLGELAGVHVHLQELRGHVPAVPLLRTHLTAVDWSHVSQVSDLVVHLVKVSRTALIAAPTSEISLASRLARTEVARGCSGVSGLVILLLLESCWTGRVILQGDEDVAWLDVEVDQLLAVDVLQTLGHVTQDPPQL